MNEGGKRGDSGKSLRGRERERNWRKEGEETVKEGEDKKGRIRMGEQQTQGELEESVREKT